MQFNDMFFSNKKLLKPAIFTFISGLFALFLFNYFKVQYNLSEVLTSRLIFITMLIVFFIVRYIQAKEEVRIYKELKRKKIKKRDSSNKED